MFAGFWIRHKAQNNINPPKPQGIPTNSKEKNANPKKEVGKNTIPPKLHPLTITPR